jgi:uncharacterized protein with PQ loop repeat
LGREREDYVMVTEIVGWLGVAFGVSVSIPQFIKSVRAKSTKGLSKHTYQLLFGAIACYLVRAIAVKEAVFIVSNSVGLVITMAILSLFKKYPSSD